MDNELGNKDPLALRNDQLKRDALSRKVDAAGCVASEKHPIACPHCEMPSNIEDLPIDYARQPNGMRAHEGTQWQCPHCEMVVHPEDWQHNDNVEPHETTGD